MNWRGPIIKLLLKASSRKILDHLGTIQELNESTREEMIRFQREKLQNLLLHAGQKVPYYRNVLCDAGVIKDGRVSLEKFEHVPALTKDIIRNEQGQLLSTDHQKRHTYRNTSGGSTGEPVPFLQDRNYSDWNIATKLFFKYVGGKKMGEPEVRFWGSDRELEYGREKLSIRLRNWLYNRTDINTFVMSEKDMGEIWEDVRRMKPAWIEGYVHSMQELTTYALENDIDFFSPKGVVSTAGVLHEPVREQLKEVFDCPVYNRYGSREVGDIACSCVEESGLHLSMWAHYVEVLDEEMEEVPPGSPGHVYVTLLTNYSMPLIRYRIGDMAVLADEFACPCGRPSAMLQSVKGRETGIFRNLSGELVHGQYFIHLLFHRPWIRQFQIIQRDYNHIIVRVVRSEPKCSDDVEEIKSGIRDVMGKDCRVTIRCLDQIEPSPSGKHLYTVSEIEN